MKKKISYAEHKHKMEYCEICDNDWKKHICTCKKSNKKAGKNIYSCFRCYKPPKKSKYHYYDQYQIFRQKAQAHGSVPEQDLFEKFIEANIKVALEEVNNK